MRFNFRKYKNKLISLIIVIALGFSTVFFTGYTSKNFELIKNLDVFASLVKELSLYYVDDIDYGKTFKKGIDEMLESLDPYTVYIPESKIEDLKFMTTGQYGGIGAMIRKHDKHVMIAQPYQDFPADKAGLKAGDIILEINDIETKGKSTSQISDMLKGQPDTEVELKVKRAVTEEEEKVKITREKVQIDPVPYQGMISNKVGYVSLRSFTNKAGSEVKKAVKNLKEDKKAEAIVLDLRNNPGGLLIEAVKICNLFVPQGELIVSTKGKVKKWNKDYKATMPSYDTEIPVVVLVNSKSASASEIVSGCMQDLDRAVVIGKKTFGKGLVQTTRELSYNAKLKVTTAKYYIPSGRCIQALDYSHRNEDGSVGKIPDSLTSEFETQNGRKVFDGGGISPDIKTEKIKLSQISKNLVRDMLVFDFANKYKHEHDSIPAPEDFKITENIYSDFISYINNKEFDYENRSEKQFEKLKEIAEDEKYLKNAEAEFEKLKEKIAHDREKDLNLFEDEIKDLLAEEIVSRYYYQSGQIQYRLQKDPDIKEAIKVLSNKQKMDSILTTVN